MGVFLDQSNRSRKFKDADLAERILTARGDSELVPRGMYQFRTRENRPFECSSARHSWIAGYPLVPIRDLASMPSVVNNTLYALCGAGLAAVI
jgi:hypothetical protein